MRLLEAKTLKAKGACQGQYKLFLATFGKSVKVTVELCQEHSDKFDWDWAARNLLSPTALAEYDRVTAPAWAEYDRVRASALAEYDRVTAPAWAEYDRVRASALAEYDRVRASALAERYRAEASSFATSYIGIKQLAAATPIEY